MTKQEFNNASNFIENEYNKALNAVKNKYRRAKDKLLIDYAKSNNPCKVGDIIEDHIGKGKIIKQNITQDFYSQYSLMVYICIELNKNGTPKKKEIIRKIHQSNLKEINGKPYRYE